MSPYPLILNRANTFEIVGGVETGGTWCVCALGDSSGAIISRERFATAQPDETLAQIASFFRELPEAAAIGVGSFGPVDVDPSSPYWGTVTTTPKPGWSNVPVAPMLARELDVPVCFETDVTAAALGEHRWGAGVGIDNLCYMTVGTGVGVGFLLEGRPWHGIVHPEVGHTRVPRGLIDDSFPGTCPYHGDCLEGLASGPAITALWGQSAEDIERGHPAWEIEADYIACALANIVFTVGPGRIIIGGGVMEQPDLLDMIRARLGQLLGSYLRSPVLDRGLHEYVVSPRLGDDAGVLGALAMALGYLERTSSHDRHRNSRSDGAERKRLPDLRRVFRKP